MVAPYRFPLAGILVSPTAPIPSAAILKSAAQVMECTGPKLDEDIGVEGLLLGKRSSESPNSFERWLNRRKEKLQKDAA